MITKNEAKLIQSLRQQKYRNQHGLFVVEGRKMVAELLNSKFETVSIYATEKYVEENDMSAIYAYELITSTQMEQMSNLTTSPGILATAKIPQRHTPDIRPDEMTLALDNVSDPGNLGTIIRTADWFGIRNIICSNDCVEAWNPKVVQSTMGSIFRVDVTKTDLADFILQNKDIKTYGALLNGKDIFSDNLDFKGGIIVIGSESHGISDNVKRLIDTAITIPKPATCVTESLNASIATAVITSELFRKAHY